MVAGGSSGSSEVDIGGEGRGSKKLISDTLVSSENAVLSSNDLLTEILLLLPAFSLLLSKLVSKQWFSVITSPAFTLRHSQTSKINPPLGLFVRRPKPKPKRKSINISKSKRTMFEYAFISFDIRVPSKRSTVFTFGSKTPARILQSCDSLLLCYITPDKFFVYNPCANMFKMLPQPDMSKLKSSSSVGGIRLVFDPTESPYYKVVHARLVNDDNDAGSYILIETYSSETGNWSVCAHRIYAYQNFRDFEDGIYWNGAVHWLSYGNRRLWHSRLDILVDHPVFKTTKPPGLLDEDLCCGGKLFVSRGCLLLASKSDTCSAQLRIYEMRNVYSGWSVKYLIDLQDFMLPPHCFTWEIHSSAWCIVLGEREEDSFMVIESHGKVLQYKIALNTVHTLFDFGSNSPRESFPFIESFAGM